jgi:hypothetical protein
VFGTPTWPHQRRLTVVVLVRGNLVAQSV